MISVVWLEYLPTIFSEPSLLVAQLCFKDVISYCIISEFVQNLPMVFSINAVIQLSVVWLD